ncbi:MAG TPA: alpha/beta fold hydrolase [Bryobacteraceae bacterium]|nr:alpha/beta fold hydrolase [Bryobacteraceae bacterium]
MRLIWMFLALLAPAAAWQPVPAPAGDPVYDGRTDEVLKAIDDVNWRLALADSAEVQKVRYTSLPPHRETNPTAQGAGNPMVIPAYVFIPKKLDRSRKQPLLVFVHGGVHSNFGSSSYIHIVRELLDQGYTILAPEYRGSTGYGSAFYRHIDYGGRENDDVFAGRNWALETYPFLDASRVGILGWSHGGMITLMNIFDHPGAYAAAYAGVPVSDLVARMGYKSAEYRRLFSAPYHIGKSAEDDVKEYLRRSPVTHAEKLAAPLLIHTNTNDEDVNVLEVERLIAALKAAGKKFEYKIYENAPGGHIFNRLDTKLARESRAEVWRFLAGYLKAGRSEERGAARR